MATDANGNDAPFKITLRELPLPVRLVLSLFLLAVGLGYFSALVQLHFQNASRGEPLPTPNDVVEIFSGVENWPVQMPAPPKPVSKMEKLIMAPEDLPHNGSGTMAIRLLRQEAAAGQAAGTGRRTAGGPGLDQRARRRAESGLRKRRISSAGVAGRPPDDEGLPGGRQHPGEVASFTTRCDKCHDRCGHAGKKTARRLLRLRRRADGPDRRPYQPADEPGTPDANDAPAPAQLLHAVDADRPDLRVQQLSEVVPLHPGADRAAGPGGGRELLVAGAGWRASAPTSPWPSSAPGPSWASAWRCKSC